MPRCLVVHATSLLLRGYLTTADERQAPDGSRVNAIYASARALRSAISFKEPAFAVAVFDAASDRSAWTPSFAKQHARFEEVLSAHGIGAVHSVQPADLVAAYVRAARSAGHDAVVVGSDKRLAQLVADDVWWYDPYKDVRYTPAMVRKRFEVGPDQVADWLALVGDDDTLPGVKGIGKKGASGLLAEFTTIESALQAADTVSGRTGRALRADPDAVRRALASARLRGDVPLPKPLSDFPYVAPEPAALDRLYRDLGFVELLAPARASAEVTVCQSADAVDRAIRSIGPVMIVDVITEDPSAVRGELAGIAFAAPGETPHYVSLTSEEAPLGLIPASLREALEDPGRAKIGHDTTRAEVALARIGITLRGVYGDTACASHLHEPSNWAPHDLEVVAQHAIGRALATEDAVRGTGRGRRSWKRVPTKKASSYLADRIRAIGAVWAALEPTTDRTLLDEYLALSSLLVRMELHGMACDVQDLEAAGDDFDALRESLEAEIYDLAGKTFNLGSPQQLGAVLFEDLGLPVVSRTKTGWSTATPALERIESAHPIVGRVIRWRLLRRLKDTWVTALIASVDPDGRVRSTFYPARSFSGRLVNASPDLGRVPAKTPEMMRIRHAFIAPEGNTLLSVDYQQLGLYVLAHLTDDPALVEPLRAGQDMHTLTASAVLEKPPGEIGRDERQIGKLVNFATFAGQGASALALQLGIDAAEAKQLIARFDRRYAVTRAFQDTQLQLAQERGYIETIAGRRWPIGGLTSPDTMARSYAERLARRATHEGSVADVSRRGLLHADQALRAHGLSAYPLLQILDEVLFEVPNHELARTIEVVTQAMRRAYPLTVPLRVGAKAGPTWANLTPVADVPT